jgi:exopolysaccharide biosynthesis protein
VSGRVTSLPSFNLIVNRLLLLFLLSPVCSRADWEILDRRDWHVSDGNLAASELRVTDGAAEGQVNLVYFAAADVTLEVIANTDGQIQALDKLIESRGGSAGINGGYFEANLDPVGLLISNDHVVHRLQKAKLLSGIFYVKDGRPRLARTREFPGTKGIEQAIQCGPFLVDGGRTVTGLDDVRTAARTFVFSCGPLVWGFGICRSVTLEEMGDILAQTAIVPDHHVIRALNFDGGSSTTFYVRTHGGIIFSEGRPVVSNYLVVKAKH